MNRRIEIIYVVDDDDIYQYAVKKKILKRKLSAEVSTFKNGKDAILHLGEVVKVGGRLPDVIFLDLNMPIMDGWDFLNEYARLRPHVNKKILLYIVSSSIQDSDIDRARSMYGVTDYIVKPIDDERLDDILIPA
ncbi:response regulator [Imperialibacter roseus]|uniref:Response regulator n=1 Tax=Imperialibacter roseus TaxID=1324217 RepID=A0ABZ0IIM0_9BACT|nr:response regulator [Imperialibacter roseus]WOK04344.1 response regulator [Imperialibacter roseus]|tara:strand:+ start:51804 stop:52205 length:402 start_codon:yes stop_codon:yes gene_type:complete